MTMLELDFVRIEHVQGARVRSVTPGALRGTRFALEPRWSPRNTVFTKHRG
jgi:hypothetical protein